MIQLYNFTIYVRSASIGGLLCAVIQKLADKKYVKYMSTISL